MPKSGGGDAAGVCRPGLEGSAVGLPSLGASRSGLWKKPAWKQSPAHPASPETSLQATRDSLRHSSSPGKVARRTVQLTPRDLRSRPSVLF